MPCKPREVCSGVFGSNLVLANVICDRNVGSATHQMSNKTEGINRRNGYDAWMRLIASFKTKLFIDITNSY